MVVMRSEPLPPNSSGIGKPCTPKAAHFFHPSKEKPRSASRSFMLLLSSARAKSIAAFWSDSCSGVRSKSIGRFRRASFRVLRWQSIGEDFGDVADGHFTTASGNAVRRHGQTKRARDGQRARTGAESFGDPALSYSFVGSVVEPHSSATGAAT